MPLTRLAPRPIDRASASSKRMAMPWRVLSTTSSPACVTTTPMSESPSSRPMPMMPPLRGRAAGHSLAAAMLAAVRVERQPFHVAVVADGDGVGLLDDQVFHVDPAGLTGDFGAALVAELVAHFGQVGPDHFEDVALAAQELLVADDMAAQ